MENVRPLTRDLLEWVARAPRVYADVSETWPSTCPRFTVWEDALEAGLVRLERCSGLRFGEERVTLTERGRVVLTREQASAGNEGNNLAE